MLYFLSYIEIYVTRPELSFGQMIPRESLDSCFEYIYGQIEYYMSRFSPSSSNTEFDPEIDDFVYIDGMQIKKIYDFESCMALWKKYLNDIQADQARSAEFKIQTYNDTLFFENIITLSYDAETKKINFKHSVNAELQKLYIFQTFSF